MEATRSPAFTRARIVALALIGLATLGLAYLHFATGDDAVGVPSGARAGQLTLQPCHYGDGGRQRTRRLRDAGRAREPARPALAADRAAGDADSCAFGGAGTSHLPAPGRPRNHQHELRGREQVRRAARCRPRRLPRHRWIVQTRLPGGRVGARARRRSPQRAGVPRDRRRVQGVREAPSARRRRPRRLLATRARR